MRKEKKKRKTQNPKSESLRKFEQFSECREALLNSEHTAVQILSYFTERIQQKGEINAFLEVFEESALAKAKEIDKKLSEGHPLGKLAGMVVSIKDNICYQGHKISASSHILEGFESLFSSTVVERLLSEDAIIIGRTNCDEFAMGSSNENSYFGNVKNPHNLKTSPGGSSGGASASVAAGLCHLSLGSDTGGSIRQPASFTGTIGLKPTYGRVSRHGLIAYASSFDQIGPISNSLDSIALVLEVIAGGDEYDSTCSNREVPAFSKVIQKKSKKRKIAYLDSHLNHEGLNPEVKQRMIELINTLRSEGHIVEECSFDLLDQLIPIYQVLTTAEASSNLARYDGIHFGYRSEKATDLYTTYVKSRSEGFGKEVKRRIMLGTYVLSEGYYDAYFSKAQKVRRMLKERTESILSEYDFILSPSTPHAAFKLGSQNEDPIKMYLEDIYTVQANLTGQPAISIPIAESNGMPVGIQLMGKHFEEEDLLSFSDELLHNPSLKKDQV
jgi:aspartyl-tRNA(Asn)/glutamyl-tRNA(Gln) amidotransferase subunit A